MSDKRGDEDEDLTIILSEYKKLGETEKSTASRSMDSLAHWIADRFQLTVVKAYQILPDLMARLSLIVP